MAITKLSNSGIKTQTNLKYDSMLAGNAAYQPTSYDSIASVSVGSGGTAYAEFSSIPSDYTHLEIRLYGMGSGSNSNVNVRMRINDDTGSNYNNHNVFAVGSGSLNPVEQVNQTSSWVGQMANGENTYFSPLVINLFDYANSTTNKTFFSIGGESTDGSNQEYLGFYASSWGNTNAITKVRVYPESGNFAQYSHIALYGIRG